LALAALRQGAFARATQRWEEALALCREFGDRQGIALVTAGLGLTARWHGDAARATARAEELLALPWPAGDAATTRLALLLLGLVARDQGDTARAVDLLEQSLAIARRTRGAYLGEILRGHTLAALGSAVLEQGDRARAAGLYEECLAVFDEEVSDDARFVDQDAIGLALTGLGRVARLQGDAARARTRYAESLALCRGMGLRLVVPGTLEEMAHLAAAADAAGEERSRAARLLGAAAALRRALGMPLPPVERPAYQQTVETLRAVLGEAAWATEWAAGQELSWDEAITLGLSPAAGPGSSDEAGPS
jgi:tetratricopeptide (TPR) repeat protein